MVDKVLIVGAGATGSISASLLAERSLHSFFITVWDKGRGAGGRMTTHRFGSGQHVDLGAQYITRFNNSTDATNDLKDRLFEELRNSGILTPLSGTIEGESPVSADEECIHLVSGGGLSAVPKYFLKKSTAKCQFSRQLTAVNINSTSRLIECGWREDDSEKWEEFKCLILTLPVPQLLSLEGNFLKYLDQSHLDNLKQVKYSSRYALGLCFKDYTPKTSWTAKYIKHPIIRYICWDNLKRTSFPLLPDKPSLLVHTSVPFGLKHLDTDKAEVGLQISSALLDILPDLPPPSDSYLIRWRYSQVFKPYPGTPGSVVLHTNPLVVATGDAFTHSNLEGCIEAAHSVTEAVLKGISK